MIESFEKKEAVSPHIFFSAEEVGKALKLIVQRLNQLNGGEQEEKAERRI